MESLSRMTGLTKGQRRAALFVLVFVCWFAMLAEDEGMELAEAALAALADFEADKARAALAAVETLEADQAREAKAK